MNTDFIRFQYDNRIETAKPLNRPFYREGHEGVEGVKIMVKTVFTMKDMKIMKEIMR